VRPGLIRSGPTDRVRVAEAQGDGRGGDAEAEGELLGGGRSWLATARHPRFGRPYPQTVYQPMLEVLSLLDRNGFSCWIFSGGGTDFMRAWAADVYGLPPHRVIGSVGDTEFRISDGRPELVKGATIQIVNDGPQKPSSIHRHVGQRPIVAAGNTDGDLAMLQWTAASRHRTPATRRPPY
jgi:haloacid dehalogenase-like hydrolase